MCKISDAQQTFQWIMLVMVLTMLFICVNESGSDRRSYT